MFSQVAACEPGRPHAAGFRRSGLRPPWARRELRSRSTHCPVISAFARGLYE